MQPDYLTIRILLRYLHFRSTGWQSPIHQPYQGDSHQGRKKCCYGSVLSPDSRSRDHTAASWTHLQGNTDEYRPLQLGQVNNMLFYSVDVLSDSFSFQSLYKFWNILDFEIVIVKASYIQLSNELIFHSRPQMANLVIANSCRKVLPFYKLGNIIHFTCMIQRSFHSKIFSILTFSF